MIRLQGYCPMGCGQTLHAEEMQAENKIVCMGESCPDPLAVQNILSNPEMEHIIHFDEDGFTVHHPLRERIGDSLFDCHLHRVCIGFSGPPGDQQGVYRARLQDDEWIFTLLREEDQ